MSRTESTVVSPAIEWIKTDRLIFDHLNPRLPRAIDAHSKSAVLNWMLEDASLLELMQSIAVQGYFPGEPLIVVPAGQRFVVVEGNRRLAAVLLLSAPSLASTRRKALQSITANASARPRELPCLVFQSRDSVIDYLGYRHVTGIKEWEPLAKARYVEQLLEAGHAKGTDALGIVARKIGSRRDYLARLMAALALYDRAATLGVIGQADLGESDVNFSLITLALSYPSIRAFVGLTEDSKEIRGHSDNIRDLFHWMFRQLPNGGTVLGDSRNIGGLAAVVGKPPALKALRSGRALSDAALLTEAPLAVFRTSIIEAKERLQTATLQLAAVQSVTDDDVAAVEEIVAAGRDLLTILRSRREHAASSSSE